ncbi:MAG: hypothetical protein NVSMB23_11610 [Myxococcales bacterium]
MRIPLPTSPAALALFLAALPGPAPAAPLAERVGEPALRSANAARQESIGLSPLALPAGQEALQERLAARLHDGAAVLPGIRAFDLIPRGICLPDEGGCLAEAARGAGLDGIVSARIEARPQGYRFHVRAWTARDGALRGEEQGEVEGGPLDLAGALEHGVCAALGRAPCAGTLRVRVEEGAGPARLVVDGQDLGSLPLAQPAPLAVGRHLVEAGGAERRVRISYGREAQLVRTARAGTPVLLDAAEAAIDAVPAAALAEGPGPRASGPDRAMVARFLVGAGAALLATSAGLELYARTNAAQADPRTRSGALAEAGASPSRGANTAGTAALLLGATGVGALAAGGLLFLATPGGVSAAGKF